MIVEYEWQKQGKVWVFGKNIRGLVRAHVGEVHRRRTGWYVWRVASQGMCGEADSLQLAVAAVERALHADTPQTK